MSFGSRLARYCVELRVRLHRPGRHCFNLSAVGTFYFFVKLAHPAGITESVSVTKRTIENRNE